MRILIYSLCKNEEHNIVAWMDHIQDADYIVVGDTGSSDSSISLLFSLGALVYPITVDPWRFDVARNRLLELIPDDVDVCISLDFDERLCDGWRKIIEDLWKEKSTRISYPYTEIEATSPPTVTTIMSSRIHHRKHYKWVYPVHELLQYYGTEQEVVVPTTMLTITHRPDKSKERNSYLHLMELAILEHPDDVRLIHQLGRDYLKHKLWDKGIASLQQNLLMKHAPIEQKFACRRLIARALSGKNEYSKALTLLKELIVENSSCSSTYVEYLLIAYQFKNWNNILELRSSIDNIDYHYISIYNEFKNAKFIIYDVMAMAYYHVKDYKLALHYTEIALALAPNEQRIQKNRVYFKHISQGFQ